MKMSIDVVVFDIKNSAKMNECRVWLVVDVSEKVGKEEMRINTIGNERKRCGVV